VLLAALEKPRRCSIERPRWMELPCDTNHSFQGVAHDAEQGVFIEDPTTQQIPNLGVAKVEEPTTPEEWEVLRYELSHFVCEGEYERGLERILPTFLNNIGKPQQPAAWVSGFYGSGKSHLVRVLQYLWTDFRFPDGTTAQELANLPATVTDPLAELKTLASEVEEPGRLRARSGPGRATVSGWPFSRSFFAELGSRGMWPRHGSCCG
jgi:hypothetical protein